MSINQVAELSNAMFRGRKMYCVVCDDEKNGTYCDECGARLKSQKKFSKKELEDLDRRKRILAAGNAARELMEQ